MLRGSAEISNIWNGCTELHSNWAALCAFILCHVLLNTHELVHADQ